MIAAIRIALLAVLAYLGILAAVRLILANTAMVATKVAYFGWMPVAVELAITLSRTPTAAMLAALHPEHKEQVK
ncbi:hypothetical protein ACFSGX_12125 [Sphingomonas arantia]|uniref:Uncharacterized protein n=1 Tax=Sphingomonas arantia TaxID=1460676 RepID=A0ABW4TXV0_9SPHN